MYGDQTHCWALRVVPHALPSQKPTSTNDQGTQILARRMGDYAPTRGSLRHGWAKAHFFAGTVAVAVAMQLAIGCY
eukprot:647845-Rhodomonas_salina.1